MEIQKCSLCHRSATWVIDKELFCEGHKEKIIEAVGVDRFSIRRLTEAEIAFQVGGRFSPSTTKRTKGRYKANIEAQ
jgi:hypothetical protein